MTLDEFRATLSHASPPADTGLAVQALWWLGNNDWKQAHGCVQQNEGDPACDWVHAHLHRLEGDLGNAGYWYRRAGRTMAGSPDEEWTTIASELLSRP